MGQESRFVPIYVFSLFVRLFVCPSGYAPTISGVDLSRRKVYFTHVSRKCVDARNSLNKLGSLLSVVYLLIILFTSLIVCHAVHLLGFVRFSFVKLSDCRWVL